MTVKKSFLKKLNAMRHEAGFAFLVNSGARCPAYNRKIGGAPNSAHTYGKAVDLRAYGAKADKIIELSYKHAMTGRGISQKGQHNKRFIHVDCMDNSPSHPRPWMWSY